jgi:hypothetical protein
LQLARTAGGLQQIVLIFESYLPLPKYTLAKPNRYKGTYAEVLDQRGQHVLTQIAFLRLALATKKKYSKYFFFIVLAPNEADQVLYNPNHPNHPNNFNNPNYNK